MELSKTIIDNISYTVGNDSVITDSQYLCILNEIFSSASGKNISKGAYLYHGTGGFGVGANCSRLTNGSVVTGKDEKIAHSSLLSLLLEASKHDVHPTNLSSVLEECQIGSQRISTFIKMYQENKEKIQLQLSLIGKNYDQIIDVDWRQDYIIKSSNCEKISEPSYIISLKTWNTQYNSEKNITFGCTLEQLQDLVLKLKGATKCIERNST